jgi:hypothetical protein
MSSSIAEGRPLSGTSVARQFRMGNSREQGSDAKPDRRTSPGISGSTTHIRLDAYSSAD